MRRRGADGASVHVLEAVTVASVMIASVAFVVTLDTAPPANEGVRVMLLQTADDALSILNDTPLDSVLGSNLLTVSIQECLQNDCDRLRTRLDTLLPEGARYGVYLSTPEGLYPVYSPDTPPGEAVSARRLIEPAWSYQFLGTGQSMVDPTSEPLVVYALPVFSGNPLEQGGNGLRIVATGNRSSDNAGYVLAGSGTTRAVDSDDIPLPSATSLYFADGSGNAAATLDVRATSLLLGLTPSGAPVGFTVRINETGGGSVPAGTILTIDVPHGWNATASSAVNAPRWTVLSNATDRNGTASSVVTAKLLSSVTSGTVDFQFNATYHGDVNEWYPFAATLSSGAYAHAQTLVRADDKVFTSTFETPAVLASVPRPMGVSAITTWTVTAYSADAVDITRLEVQEEEGRDIFADVEGVSGGGTWAHEADKLVWTGSATLGPDTPLALTFRVTSSSAGGLASDKPPYTPSVGLGAFTGTLGTEVAPGLYRGVFMPSSATYKGYETSTGLGLYASHLAESASVYRTTALPGEVSYDVGYAVDLSQSVFGSASEMHERSVSPGQTATFDVDVQSTMYTLALLGMTPSIDVVVYPPWSGASREPVIQREIYNGTVAAGADDFLSLIDTDDDGTPEPSATMGRHSVSVDVPQGWLYGPYVVETKVHWFETLDETIDGTHLVETVARTASLYDYFVVKPEGRDLPPSPLYDVHLVTWFEEWG